VVPGEAGTARKGRNGERHCAAIGKLLPFTTRTAYSAILSAAGGNISAVITSIGLEDAVFNDLYPRTDAARLRVDIAALETSVHVDLTALKASLIMQVNGGPAVRRARRAHAEMRGGRA
jgi:hypothetical protein